MAVRAYLRRPGRQPGWRPSQRSGAFAAWYAVTDTVPSRLISTTPYVVTLLVLAVSAQKLRPPAADGRPYRRGQQS